MFKRVLARARGEIRRRRPPRGFPAGHYYSALPDFESLLTAPAAEPPAALAGIEMRVPEQLALLRRLAAHAGSAPWSDERQPGLRYWYRNAFYATADATVLHAMLLELRPRRVLEIGSGFSSAVMLDTRDVHGLAVELTFVDPNPRRLHSLLTAQDEGRVEVHEARVQDVPISALEKLAPGDVLFVDSSHVLKLGSDVNHILFELLPRLPAGVHVHFHDCFYPFEYPRAYHERHWAWNELYALRALLQDSGRWSIALFPSQLEHRHPQELADALPLAMTEAPGWPGVRGASLWIASR